jgi:uncharacterized protein
MRQNKNLEHGFDPIKNKLALTPMARLKRVLALALALYLAAAGFMTLFQRSFLYHPAPSWQEPSEHGLPQAQAISLAAQDGTGLRGWWIAPKHDSAPIYLYFHGNADGLSKRAKRFGLMSQEGAGILALSYRGYGGSGGKPREDFLHQDALSAYAFLAKAYDPGRIVIFGESLGTGVALNLARQKPAKAIVLDSPYLSVLARAQASYPWLPVAHLLTDTFRSDLWISEIKTPILILHGTADDLIPPSDSEKLAARAPKITTRILYKDAPHVVPYDQGPMRDVPEFLEHVAQKWAPVLR